MTNRIDRRRSRLIELDEYALPMPREQRQPMRELRQRGAINRAANAWKPPAPKRK